MTSIELGRPLAASLILAALVSLGALAMVAAWADLSSAEAEREAKSEFVSRSVPASRRAEGAGGPAGSGDLFVSADSETLAAAQVDALVRAMAKETEAAVLSSRAEAKHDEPGLAGRIEVQVVVEATNDALQALLLTMESRTPMLLVDTVAIQPVSTTSADPEEAVSPRLHASLALSAYWRGAQK